MKVKTPEIVWHNKQPVFTVDFHRSGPNWRMVTGGADNEVKVGSHTSETCLIARLMYLILILY